MKFTKMHGLGNDYLYVYTDKVPDYAGKLSITLSNRYFGAGSDGMIWILPSNIADYQMRIFNADGSEAMMCGNGIRCVGKYVYDNGYTDKKRITIETLSGIKTLNLTTVDNKVTSVSVDMGTATIGEPKKANICDQTICYIPVSVGNPHAVVVVENAEEAPLTTVGAALEKYPAFPDRTNVEFVSRISENEFRMRVWERGSGITMACGTGAYATVAALVSAKLCKADTDIRVKLDGGWLTICYHSDGSITKTGPATMVYDGEVTDDYVKQALQ